MVQILSEKEMNINKHNSIRKRETVIYKYSVYWGWTMCMHDKNYEYAKKHNINICINTICMHIDMIKTVCVQKSTI